MADIDFKPDIPTNARFLQARTALAEDGQETIILDFEMSDFETPTTVGLACSLKDARKLVHTCLAALASFGDQPASVLLEILKSSCQKANGK